MLKKLIKYWSKKWISLRLSFHNTEINVKMMAPSSSLDSEFLVSLTHCCTLFIWVPVSHICHEKQRKERGREGRREEGRGLGGYSICLWSVCSHSDWESRLCIRWSCLSRDFAFSQGGKAVPWKISSLTEKSEVWAKWIMLPSWPEMAHNEATCFMLGCVRLVLRDSFFCKRI